MNIWTSVAVTDPTPVHIDSNTNICGHETNISICHLVSASFARVKLGKAFLDSPLGAGSKLEAPRWSSRQGVLRFVNSKKKQWPSDMWDPLICLFVSYRVLLVLSLFLCLFWLRFSKKFFFFFCLPSYLTGLRITCFDVFICVPTTLLWDQQIPHIINMRREKYLSAYIYRRYQFRVIVHAVIDVTFSFLFIYDSSFVSFVRVILSKMRQCLTKALRLHINSSCSAMRRVQPIKENEA